MEKSQSIQGFYAYYNSLIPHNIKEEIGHFNIFELEDLGEAKAKCSSFGRKEYYKISLMKGRNRYYYGDQVAHIEKYALVFANPQTPYHWEPEDEDQSGVFCIFTPDFFHHSSAQRLQEYPVFKDVNHSVMQLTEEQYIEFRSLFDKMNDEIDSDYYYKYDVLRNMVLDIVHSALKIQSVAIRKHAISGSERISSQFVELLERQFPIESPSQRLQMRFAMDFSKVLRVHVNHLNKAIKETSGKTTTNLISERILQEAKILLKHTQWSISEIAWCLGFEELPHLINFFKKNTGQTPKLYRNS
ncbi:AraC family transcriptional regulator [Pedobacter sp. HMWF019]|uniref:helix-turn-helix domain-containing protein n=1 Tax=Pedobacter sp. HMWF019 TaxID=2056856 RepID=UPI000D3C23C9|nr:AraC family transcriptional regulator [Pedobacter sp. HMWF019]PTT01861.1 AraC family transcriptional regulator [Pedobacter sp. HMWF019]